MTQHRSNAEAPHGETPQGRGGETPSLARVDRIICSSVVFTAIVSALGLVTLAGGVFTVSVVLAVGALGTGLYAVWGWVPPASSPPFRKFLYRAKFWRTGCERGPGSRGEAPRYRRMRTRSPTISPLILGLIAALALGLRWNGGDFPFGGQDPGVYTNVGAAIARTGGASVVDPVLPLVRNRPELLAPYLEHSYLRVKMRSGGDGSGIVLPGLYLRSLTSGEQNPQFYHLHPLWLAIGDYLGGLRGQNLIVALFSSGSVFILGALAAIVARSAVAGYVGAFLLAINPAHSYIGTVPLSESIAGFFFLAAIYLVTVGRFGLALGPIAGLFFTRITGFVSAPLLILGLVWITWSRRDRRAAALALAILGAFAASFYWGLTYSPQYANDIYRGKLGLSKDALAGMWAVFLVGGAALSLLVARAERAHTPAIRLLRWLRRWRTTIVAVLLSVAASVIVYRLYLLGFTDTFESHRWYGRRWKIAGNGFDAVERSSIYSLALMLTPVGFVAFIVGLPIVLRRAFSQALLAPLAFLTLGFLVALTARQLTTPYLYYYGRYLVSELLPLGILCSVVTLTALTRWIGGTAHRGRAIGRAVWVAFVVGCCISGFPALKARLAVKEGGNFAAALECIASAVPGRAAILVEDGGLRETLVGMPIRLRYGLPVVSVPRDPGVRAPWLEPLIELLRENGYSVVALGAKSFVPPVGVSHHLVDIPATITSLRRVGGLPRRARTRSYDYTVWTADPVGNVPDRCRFTAGGPGSIELP